MVCSWLVLLVTLHIALYFFPCRQGQDTLHLGWYGSEELACLQGRQHPCRGAEADSLGPLSIVIPHLQYIDKVVDVCCAGVGDGRDLTVAWSISWRSSSTVMDVPMIMQRRLRQWKCTIFSSSPELVYIFVRNRGIGMVAAMRGSLLQFCSIFRPPSIWTSRLRQWHDYCWYAGYDAFALCSLRRRQARGVSTGAVRGQVMGMLVVVRRQVSRSRQCILSGGSAVAALPQGR